MTNAIEQAKREMFNCLAFLKFHVQQLGIEIGGSEFESALEAYLEQVRQDHEALHETARKRFEDVQALEAANQKLQHCNDIQRETIEILRSRLSAMTEERDAIQLRLHAVDHAYSEQQRKAGTCGQVYGDRGASEQPDAKTMALLSVIVDCQQLVSDWAVYGYRAKKQMKKMAYVLNNNPELRAALDHFDGVKS